MERTRPTAADYANADAYAALQATKGMGALRGRVEALEKDLHLMRILMLRIVNGQRVEGIRFRRDGSVYFEGRKRRVRYAYKRGN